MNVKMIDSEPMNGTDATLWDIERDPALRTTVVSILQLDRSVKPERLLRSIDESSRLMPRTGRSHQLRVHMATLGHPICGDRLYAGERWQQHPRLMLHARYLRLRHPEDGRWCEWQAPMPAPMAALAAQLTPEAQ